jgi:YidC/Oxa1 family membrane protein insertase
LLAFWAPEFIVAPMRTVLEQLVAYTGNYGLAIILLTLAVRVVILPLTIYQTKSMKKMQEVQPLLKEIQAKYKEEPQKLQQEMMQLYKTHGVNPISGCLPMLIQMPFLVALFVVLQQFDPKGLGVSESFLWIENLNQAASLDIANLSSLVLPVLAVGSMFLQSYLSMVGNDPNQRMMMYMMPLLFGYFSFTMQAGVVLYWVTSTMIGLGQQAIYPGFPRLKPKGEAEVR